MIVFQRRGKLLLLLAAAIALFSGISFADENVKPMGAAIPQQQQKIQGEQHSVRIEYCTSWGMQRNYLQIKKFLEEQYPELRGNISGGNWPPPPYVKYLQHFLSIIHLLTVAAVFLGERFWTLIPFVRSTPQWYHSLKEYPMQTFVFIFVIAPSFVSSAATSGAFEIYMDGEVIWSKLQTGQFPDGQQLLNLFRVALSKWRVFGMVMLDCGLWTGILKRVGWVRWGIGWMFVSGRGVCHGDVIWRDAEGFNATYWL